VNGIDWIVREAQSLSPEERIRAIELPVEIAQNVTSRIAARAVRWIFSERQQKSTQNNPMAS